MSLQYSLKAKLNGQSTEQVLVLNSLAGVALIVIIA
jgi:hypothetical protein